MERLSYLAKNTFLTSIILSSIFMGACSNRRAQIVGGGDPSSEIVIDLKGRLSGSGSFVANGITIDEHEEVQLSWVVTGSPSHCALHNVSVTPPEEVVADAINEGTFVSPSLEESVRYELTCNKGLNFALASFEVTVNEVVPQLPALTVNLKGRLTNTGAYVEEGMAIYTGQTLDLQYIITGSPTSCTLKNTLVNPHATVAVSTIDADEFRTGAINTAMNLRLRCERGSDIAFKDFAVSASAAPVVQLAVTGGPYYDFGNVTVGQTKDQVFTITNTGNVSIAQITVGAITAPFTVTNISSCSSTLLPGATCTFTARFSPVAAGRPATALRPPPGAAADLLLELSYGFTGSNFLMGFDGTGVAVVAPHGLDGTFGTSGKMQAGNRLNVAAGSLNNAEGIAIQRVGTQDKYLVHGRTLAYVANAPNGYGYTDGMGIARINANGSIDTSFGQSGLAVTPFTLASSAQVMRVRVLSDNKILAIGRIGVMGSGGTWARVLMTKYTADGQPDTTFGSNGVVISDLHNGAIGQDGVVTSDGKIIVIARVMGSGTTGWTAGAHLLRYSANGSLENARLYSLARNGGTYNFPTRVILQADGKILIGGVSQCQTALGYSLAVSRFLADGSIDSGFGNNGVVCIAPSNDNYRGTGIFLRGTDIVIAGGDGTVATLSSAGTVTSVFTAPNTYLLGSAIRSDGKVLLSGNIGGAVAKLFNVDGSVARTYAAAGFSGSVNGAIAEADNKVVVFGGVLNGTAQVFMSRFLP